MTRDEKQRIRKRDRYWYSKLHGAIPKGYTMHHNYYNELWYDEDAFIIITKEEHDWIHGHAIPCSEGFNYAEYYADNREERINYQREYRTNNREKINNYNKEYRKAHREEVKEYQANYNQLNKDKRNEQSRNYYAKVKAVRESFCLTEKQWRALTKDDRKRLRDAFRQNGGNI